MFNDPNAQLFSFDAVITARVQVSQGSNRYQPEPPPDLACFENRTQAAAFDGVVPGGDTGLQLIPGVSYVDVPFTSQEGAFGVIGGMTLGLVSSVVLAMIGPAMRGTALRDSLDFVDFNSFKNQIDFAQFGKSFNTYANAAVLSKLPREGLDGKQVKLLGAYVPASGSDLPLMTPAEAEIGSAQ